MFSRTSERLRSNNAITLSDLQLEVGTMYNKYTKVQCLDLIANWSGLCDSERSLANVLHITQYRHFSFSKNFSDIDSRDRDTECLVKLDVKDDWHALRVLRGIKRGRGNRANE